MAPDEAKLNDLMHATGVGTVALAATGARSNSTSTGSGRCDLQSNGVVQIPSSLSSSCVASSVSGDEDEGVLANSNHHNSLHRLNDFGDSKKSKPAKTYTEELNIRSAIEDKSAFLHNHLMHSLSNEEDDKQHNSLSNRSQPSNNPSSIYISLDAGNPHDDDTDPHIEENHKNHQQLIHEKDSFDSTTTYTTGTTVATTDHGNGAGRRKNSSSSDEQETQCLMPSSQQNSESGGGRRNHGSHGSFSRLKNSNSISEPLSGGGSRRLKQNSNCEPCDAGYVPDGGFYAWLVCFAAYITNGTIFGVVNCFGVLFFYLKEHFQKEGEEAGENAFQICKYIFVFISSFSHLHGHTLHMQRVTGLA